MFKGSAWLKGAVKRTAVEVQKREARQHMAETHLQQASVVQRRQAFASRAARQVHPARRDGLGGTEGLGNRARPVCPEPLVLDQQFGPGPPGPPDELGPAGEFGAEGLPGRPAQKARLVSKGRKDRPDPLARRAQLVSQETESVQLEELEELPLNPFDEIFGEGWWDNAKSEEWDKLTLEHNFHCQIDRQNTQIGQIEPNSTDQNPPLTESDHSGQIEPNSTDQNPPLTEWKNEIGQTAPNHKYRHNEQKELMKRYYEIKDKTKISDENIAKMLNIGTNTLTLEILRMLAAHRRHFQMCPSIVGAVFCGQGGACQGHRHQKNVTSSL
uniref:Uncharacterized protein n=1 Tax=Globodera rostochiensis TaxID=31243 RepID=A0A914HMN2_GLORO